MFEWNDIRFFLAVARSGSTLAASRKLGVSQATVSRRIGSFEEQLGIELFVRAASGYALTPRGSALVPMAEGVERAAEHFADAAQSESRRLSGVVRMTTVESAARAWVIPAVAKLRETMPDIEVEIVTSDQNLDIARGEADFAIRFGPQPDDPVLVVRRLTEMEECVFARRDLAARYGWPVGPGELSQYPLVVETSGTMDRFARWLVEAAPDGRIVQRVNSMSNVIASVRSGIGAALLPTTIGDYLKDVVRITPPIEELRTPCWLVTTDQARRQPHVRAAIDCVTAYVTESTDRHMPQAEAVVLSRIGQG